MNRWPGNRLFAMKVPVEEILKQTNDEELLLEVYHGQAHRGWREEPMCRVIRVTSGNHTANLLAILFAALFLLTSECVADSQTINHFGTIQDAVNQADPGDTIHIPPGVYRETLIIAKSLKIIGAGINRTIVDGDTDQDGTGNGRVFYIAPEVTATLANMMIRNGDALKDVQIPPNGGGILNRGTLTVKHCDIRGNKADHGGGICNLADKWGTEATLNVRDSILQQNDSGGAGGGISNWADDGTAIANVWSTDVSYNSSQDPGGGIQNYALNGAATTNVWYSTILYNKAFGAHGGGIHNMADNVGAFVTLNVKFSKIEYNEAETDGGGVLNLSWSGRAIANVWNSDICFNKVASQGPGGGILNQTTTKDSRSILNVHGGKIQNNSASGGGGIYNMATLGIAVASVWRGDIYDNLAISGSGITNEASSGDGVAILRVHQTRIHHNTASFRGGIYNRANLGTAEAYVYDSNIYDNTAERGGGLFSHGTADGTAILTIINSQIIKNVAEKEGGGIWSDGTLTVEKSSILYNRAEDADQDNASTGHGGGIFYIAGEEPILLGRNNIRHNTPDDIYEGDGP
jgi:hypothetical protein